MNGGFFRVRNFEKFQHYSDRRPPWIKLYRDLWDDPRFFDLSEADRYCLMSIFVLASQHENKVSCSQKWLKTQLLMTRSIPLERLIATGWLELMEQDASAMLSASAPLAERYPSRARGETETEVQRQNTETDIQKRTAYGEFGNVLLYEHEHAKLTASLNGRLESLINRLDRWGEEEPAKFRKKKNHYATLLNWAERDGGNGNGPGRNKPVRETDHEKNQRAVNEFLDREMAREMRGDFPDVRENPRGLPGKA